MPVPKKKRPLVLSVRPAAARASAAPASAAAAPGPTQPKRKRSKPAQERENLPARSPAAAAAAACWTCASVIDQQSAEALARLLDAAATRSHGASIKSLTLAPHVVHKKPTFAVTCETLKHLPLLQAVLAATGLLQQHEPQLSPAAAYVLVYEVLFGEGLRRKGPAERAVVKQQAELRSALQQLLQEAGAKDAAAWLKDHHQQQPQPLQQQQPAVAHPRYARVNLLKASVADVLSQLQEGLSTADEDGAAAGGSRKRQRTEACSSSSGSGSRRAYSSVCVDALLPDVLVFPPGTDLHDHPLVQQGVLVLQSKASCMPAHALQPRAGWHVVDCCAAPGNKTTHVAALLHAASTTAVDAAPGGSSSSSSRVFAFDKDRKRLKRLVANVQHVGADSIVVGQHADFLSIDPSDQQFAQVQGVILDPSCSGSGTAVSRMDHLLPATAAAASPAGEDASSEQEQQRLEQLAKFQEAALLHALKFPALQRLVYSTCSIHQREDEDVVAAVLPTAQAAGFRLAEALPGWHRRGLNVLPGAELLVRTDPLQDATDGFFVAVFERARGTQAAGQQQDAASRHDGAPHSSSKEKKRKQTQQQQQQQQQQVS